MMKCAKKISARLASAVLLLAVLAGCTSTGRRERIDLIPQLDPTVINYRSQTFELSEQLPLDTTLTAGELGTHTARISPVVVPISLGGFELVDLENAKVYLRMEITPGNHDGAVSMTLIAGNSVDIYSDPAAVRVQRKMFLPAVFELSSEDPALKRIFSLHEVVFGMQFAIEPSRLDSHRIYIQGHVEQFEAEISGAQGIF